MDIQSIINAIDWTKPSWDLFIIIIFTASVFLYSFGLGRDRVFIFLISSYISLALFDKQSLILGMLGIQIDNSFLTSVAFFVGGVFILFFILSNSAFTSVFNEGLRGTWLQTAIIGFLQIGLVVSVVVSFLRPEEASALSPFIRSFFVDGQAQFFWLLSPFFAMIIFKAKL